jgi:hypothetical protein
MSDLDTLNSDALITAIATMDPSVARMVALHIMKPWIPGHKGALISPLHPGSGKWVEKKITVGSGHTWYYPSATWWKAHAHTSHPPDGAGCNPAVHAAFLTEDGKNAEFAYASLLKNGRVRILGADDFVIECAWWKKNF